MNAASHAHHVKPRKDYPELQYVVDNGMALCVAVGDDLAVVLFGDGFAENCEFNHLKPLRTL